MESKFQHFHSDRRGSVAILFAIAAMVVLGVAGFAVDYNRGLDSEIKIQAALDAAVLAAVHKEPAGRDAVAMSFFDNNGQLALGSVNSLSFITNADGSYTGTAMVSLPTAFASLVNIPVLNIAVTSTALAIATAKPCVLALERSKAQAIWVHPHAEIEAEDCGIKSNSSHDNGVHVQGEMETQFLHVAGDIGQASAGNIDSEQGITILSPAMNDPLQGLEVPSFSGCDGGTDLTVNSDRTLSPGVYCGGLTIRNGARVDLQPGIYILDGGDLDMTGITELDGENVTIILTSSGSPNDIGSFKITDHSRVRFTAPITGPFERVAIFQDRRAPTTRNNLVSGKSSGSGPAPEIEVDGTIYAPAQEIRLEHDARIEIDPAAACANIIANTFDLQQNSEIELDCDDDSLMAGTFINSVRLVK